MIRITTCIFLCAALFACTPSNKHAERPNFITLYFHDTDSYGHKYGPHSYQINESIKRLDSLIAYLNEGLKNIGLNDSTNVIIVSDHGMTELSTSNYIAIEPIKNDSLFWTISLIPLFGTLAYLCFRPSLPENQP